MTPEQRIDRLADAIAERLAPRVAALVLEQLDGNGDTPHPEAIESGAHMRAPEVPNPGPGLLTVREAADLLGRSHDFIRGHRTELGAVNLGDGPRARIYLNAEAVEAFLATTAGTTAAVPLTSARTRARRARSGSDLLPIRGQVTPLEKDEPVDGGLGEATTPEEAT